MDILFIAFTLALLKNIPNILVNIMIRIGEYQNRRDLKSLNHSVNSINESLQRLNDAVKRSGNHEI